jgi:protein-disulfide isomerase
MKKLLAAGTLLGALVCLSAIAGAPSAGAAHQGDCDAQCARRHEAPLPREATPRREAPARGPQSAKVTVEVWSDFECPFCSRGSQLAKELEKRYGRDVRIVFRHLPLPFHANARLAAAASMAAHEQDRFWEFHDALFTAPQPLDRASLEAVAGRLGMDVRRFQEALERGETERYVEAELVEARQRGITGTPTFFVNGKPVVGAQPVEAFTRLIDAELKR